MCWITCINFVAACSIFSLVLLQQTIRSSRTSTAPSDLTYYPCQGRPGPSQFQKRQSRALVSSRNPGTPHEIKHPCRLAPWEWWTVSFQPCRASKVDLPVPTWWPTCGGVACLIACRQCNMTSCRDCTWVFWLPAAPPRCRHCCSGKTGSSRHPAWASPVSSCAQAGTSRARQRDSGQCARNHLHVAQSVANLLPLEGVSVNDFWASKALEDWGKLLGEIVGILDLKYSSQDRSREDGGRQRRRYWSYHQTVSSSTTYVYCEVILGRLVSTVWVIRAGRSVQASVQTRSLIDGAFELPRVASFMAVQKTVWCSRIKMSTGVCRCRIGRRYRMGKASSAPVDEVMRLEIEIWSTGMVLEAGERLVLKVSEHSIAPVDFGAL